MDSQDRVYLCQQQQDPPVLVFDHDGHYLNSWGTGTIIDPHTVHIDQDDNMYLCDRGTHMASKMTLDGDPLLELGTRGQPSDTGCTEDSGEVLRSGGPFNMPTRMFPSPSGELYVSDGYCNSQVHRFSTDGVLINSWGTPGKTGHGEFHVPHSVWVDQDGLVYVCDRENNRVQVFSGEGDFIVQWPNVHQATDLYMDADETIFVCERHDTQGYMMTVRDKEGKVLERWSTHRIHQMWIDSQRNIYAVMGRDRAVAKWMWTG